VRDCTTILRKQKRYTQTFDCNRTKAEGTKRVCKISRQHEMHTSTRVLTFFHHSKGHSLSQFSTGYSKRRVCVSESSILKPLIVIEPKQKVQNEYFSSQDSIKCTLQHEYSPYSTTPTIIVYHSSRPVTLSDESA
jgi:hypothetical protein